VRASIGRPVVIKRMFGGRIFMMDGNMLCGVSPKGLMVRVGAVGESAALERPFATRLRPGKGMAGFLRVTPEGVADNADLDDWVERALAYVDTLPPKPVKPGR
jgi:TfoX/Sxy family transcriptional regulator of competence genes